MTDDDTIPVGDLGIGDDDVEERLREAKEAAEEHVIGESFEVSVRNDVLAGCAHVRVEQHVTVDALEWHEWLMARGYHTILPSPSDERNHYEYIVVTDDVMETLREVERENQNLD